MEYDEDLVLTNYVWSYGTSYMTELEKLGQKAVHAKFKAKDASPAMAKMILDKWGGENDPRVTQALSIGIEKFKRAVRDRVLQEHPEIVNRCPKCNKVVRTPRAKQCNWCFHMWHTG